MLYKFFLIYYYSLKLITNIMSKFMKTKSIKFNNATGANLNRISQQYNKEVVELNNQLSTASVSMPSLSVDESLPTINMTYTGKDESVSMGYLYPENDNIIGANPINNVVKVETINYGNKLDYLYKKQLHKK